MLIALCPTSQGANGRSSRGFTIVELLVAVVIGVMIATATATSIAQMFRAKNFSRSHQQAFQRADTAAARMAMDLSTVLRRSDPLQHKVSVLNSGGSGAERDELLMLMNSQRPLRGIEHEPEGDEYEVQYRVQPGPDGRDALWRRMDIGHDDYIDGGGIATPIAGCVISLSITATDQSGEWLESWDSDSDGLPHAIKIIITAVSDDGRATATAMRLVAIDRVPLPPKEEAQTEEQRDGASGTSGSAGTGGTGSSNGAGNTSGGGRPSGSGGGASNTSFSGRRWRRWRAAFDTRRHGWRVAFGRRGSPMRRGSSERRGFATVMVFGVIIVAAVIIGMIQSSAFSQAAAGRESLARVRAYWAARAGVEATIARLEYNTLSPDDGDAFKLMDEMVDVAEGSLVDASYRIATTENKKEVLGPIDAHSRLNINRMTQAQLLAIEPLMTEDIADSILDWIDVDDEPNPMGAESPYYMSLPNSYIARNGPMQSILELELVAGVNPKDLRGEDWNQNGLLDPNEDDGDASWPPDNADGELDMGWSGILTAASVDGGLAPSGQPRLDLKVAEESDIVQRTKVSSDQAGAIRRYIDNNGDRATMGDFIRRNLQTLANTNAGGGQQTRVEALSDDQLTLLLDECDIGSSSTSGPIPGKLNVNTCPAEVLRYIPEISDELADAIISERSGRAGGFSSIMELAQVPGMTRAQLANIYQLLCVRSNVYIVNSRGRDARTGLEVEMMVTLDRSTIPVVIKEVRVR